MLLIFGTIELLMVGVTSLLLWGGAIALVVFIVRFLLRKRRHDHTTATLVEENQRLRDAFAERHGE